MLIGLTGYQRVGKDTVGKYLVEEYAFTQKAFADALKEAMALLFDCSREEVDEFKEIGQDGLAKVIVAIHHETEHWMREFTWREILQRMGTEVGREYFGENFWLDRVLTTERYVNGEYPTDSQNLVITDVRFINEAERIKQLGGYLWEIKRPGHGPKEEHKSEVGVPDYMIDATIVNSTFDALYSRVNALLASIPLKEALDADC